jgi:hypothetical protein
MQNIKYIGPSFDINKALTNLKTNIQNAFTSKKNLNASITGGPDFPFEIVFTKGAYNWEYSSTSNISQHFLEDGSTVSDHTSDNPITITLSGINAEISIEKSKALNYIATAVSRLSKVDQFLPNLTQTQRERVQNLTTSTLNAVNYVNNILNTADGIFDLARKDGGNGQSLDFCMQLLEAVKIKKIPVKITLNGCSFYIDNMLIKDIKINNSYNTPYNSDVQVVLQQVGFVSVSTIQYNNQKVGGGSPMTPTKNNGIGKGTAIKQPNISMLKKGYNAFISSF